MVVASQIARRKALLVAQLMAVAGLGLAAGPALAPDRETIPPLVQVPQQQDAESRITALKRLEADEPPDTLSGTHAPLGGEVEVIFYRICAGARITGRHRFVGVNLDTAMLWIGTETVSLGSLC